MPSIDPSRSVRMGLLSLALSLLAACGTSGEGNDSATAASGAAEILFPPPGSLTTRSHIIVRGTTTAADPVTGVSVNGVAATSPDGFATFRATVPLATGDNTLTVDVHTSVGTVTGSAGVDLERAPALLSFIRSIDYDPGSDTTYVFDEYEGLWAYSHATATWNQVAGVPDPGPYTGGGALDDASGVYYQLGRSKVLSIDTSTGVQSEITGGAGPAFTISMDDIDVDEMGRAYIIGLFGAERAVLRVDLATGDRKVVSSVTVGSGPIWTFFRALYVVPGGTTGYIYGNLPDALYEVDLVTGARTLLIDVEATGERPSQTVTGLVVDPAAQVAYVASSNAIHRLDWGAQASSVRLDRDAQFPLEIGAIKDIAAGPAGTLRIGDSPSQRAGWSGLSTYNLIAPGLTHHLQARAGSGDLGMLTNVTELALDPTRANLIAADIDRRIVATDLGTGVRTVLSSDVVGSGPQMDESPEALFVDDTGTAFVGNGPEIHGVDLLTGERRQVSAVAAPGPSLDASSGLSGDPITGRLFAGSSGVDSLVRVDPLTGNRTPFGSATFDDLHDMDLDASRNRLYLATRVDPDGHIIQTADLTTGNVTPLLFTTAAGIGRVDILASDAGSGQLFVLGGHMLYEIDPTSGAHTLVTDLRDLGKGPIAGSPAALAVGALGRVVYVAAPGVIQAVDAETGERVVIAK